MKTPTESGYYWAKARIGRNFSAGEEIVLFTKTDTPTGGYVRQVGDSRLRVPGDFEWGPKAARPLETHPVVRGGEVKIIESRSPSPQYGLGGHCCGAQGFDPSRGDVCPACQARR
jgi:hypothetical protein